MMMYSRGNNASPVARLSVFLFLVALNPAHAAYIAEQLAVLPEGSAHVVRALNDGDEAVGGGRLKSKHHGFRLKRGSIEEVEGLPGSDYSVALGINDLGEIVGSANSATAVRAFRSGGNAKPVALGTLPGDSGSEALAVNQQGEAAGYSSGDAGVRAVLWSASGVITALPRLAGAKSSKAFSINDRGEAVGVSVIASDPRAVVWSGGGVTDLGMLPGHKESEALAIDNRGEVVGSSGDPGTNRHATLWSEQGVIEDLGTLEGGETSRALGINKRREVVGASHTPRGTQAFIWTREGGMQNLNHLVAAPPSGFVLTQAVSINGKGVILAIGQEEIEQVEEEGHSHDLHELPVHVFLLRPER